MITVGLKFSPFTNKYVEYNVLTFKNYYHIGGNLIHGFATVAPHMNVPMFMAWEKEDYMVLDVGQLCNSFEDALEVAKDWAIRHDTVVIVMKEEEQ